MFSSLLMEFCEASLNIKEMLAMSHFKLTLCDKFLVLKARMREMDLSIHDCIPFFGIDPIELIMVV